MSDLHYDAVGIGEQDLRQSSEFFTQTSKHKLTVLDASAGAQQSTLPYIVKNVDGVKVGVISFGAVPARADMNEYTRRKALYAAFKAARAASDILIVLDQANLATRDWVERNGKRLGAPDVVIGGSRRAYTALDEVVGKTHLVQTSIKAVHVGVVDVEIAQGQEPSFKVQRILLEPAIGEDQAITKRVKAFLVSIAQPAAGTPTQPVVSSTATHPLMCLTCHSEQYNDWAASKHARAIKTLVDQDRVRPECMNCHSEIFRRAQLIRIPPDGVGGVDCVTCHSASMPHGGERRASGLRVKVDPKTCIECHTPERSAAYEEGSYMAKVSHRNAAAPSTASSPATPPAMK